MSTYVNIFDLLFIALASQIALWILKIIQSENALTLCIVIIIQSNTEKKSCSLLYKISFKTPGAKHTFGNKQ